jgi:hypothetical protein
MRPAACEPVPVAGMVGGVVGACSTRATLVTAAVRTKARGHGALKEAAPQLR